MKKVHVVPHVHWDREWYFSSEESKLLLLNDMEEILIMLEENSSYPYYVLDGQTSIITDYLDLMPENKKRFKKLVQAGKLIIGPWYTQTDEMVVGGESIVRNLLYGYLDCQEYGTLMNIGYLPDSFGQSAQMPMILNGFGITRSIFWRGVSERSGTNKTEFYWESYDGSNVLVQLLPLGYAIGKYLPSDKRSLKKRLDKYFNVLEKGATSNHLLLPNGHDQMPIQKDIIEIVNVMNELYPNKEFFLSNYQKLFEKLEQKTDYTIIKGEFLDGKYMRVHRSIYSSRMDIKILNTKIENKLINILEPLASISSVLGFTYYSKLMESIWKLIMQNQAHDSIGCCCSDFVHQEIINNYLLAENKIDQSIKFYQRKIADAIKNDSGMERIVIYNCLPYSRDSVLECEIITRMDNFKLMNNEKREVDYIVLDKKLIDPGLVDRQLVHYSDYQPFLKYRIEFKVSIKAMGYFTYYIQELEKPMILENKLLNSDCIENEFYQIKVNPNGTLLIYDKLRDTSYDQVLQLEDGSDEGDGYDYSPLKDDYLIFSDAVNARYEIIKNKYSGIAYITILLDIPQDLVSRKKKLRDCQITINFEVCLRSHSKYIEIKTRIDNKAKDHRLRMYIPTKLIKGTYSVADNQFGRIQRNVVDSAIDVWEKESWDERPDAIYPMLSYVSLLDDPIAILTNSSREYEIVGDKHNIIAITLFRSVGYLGKKELLRRPGRPSGIYLETPDSQLIKELKFDFSLILEDRKDKLAKLAKEYLTPLIYYNANGYHAMKMNPVNFELDDNFSLFKEKGEVVLSTLKKAENNSDLIYRVYNTNDLCESVTVCSKRLQLIGVTNLKEDVIEGNLSVSTNQIKSIRFKIKK